MEGGDRPIREETTDEGKASRSRANKGRRSEQGLMNPFMAQEATMPTSSSASAPPSSPPSPAPLDPPCSPAPWSKSPWPGPCQDRQHLWILLRSALIEHLEAPYSRGRETRKPTNPLHYFLAQGFQETMSATNDEPRTAFTAPVKSQLREPQPPPIYTRARLS